MKEKERRRKEEKRRKGDERHIRPRETLIAGRCGCISALPPSKHPSQPKKSLTMKKGEETRTLALCPAGIAPNAFAASASDEYVLNQPFFRA